VFLFLLSFYFGLPWQNYLSGIALGFGVFAAIESAAVGSARRFGILADSGLSQVTAQRMAMAR